MATPRILRLGDLTRLTRLSKASIYRQIKAGSFPRPVKLGPRAVGWHQDEIDHWLASRERAGTPTPGKEALKQADGTERTANGSPW